MVRRRYFIYGACCLLWFTYLMRRIATTTPFHGVTHFNTATFYLADYPVNMPDLQLPCPLLYHSIMPYLFSYWRAALLYMRALRAFITGRRWMTQRLPPPCNGHTYLLLPDGYSSVRLRRQQPATGGCSLVPAFTCTHLFLFFCPFPTTFPARCLAAFNVADYDCNAIACRACLLCGSSLPCQHTLFSYIVCACHPFVYHSGTFWNTVLMPACKVIAWTLYPCLCLCTLLPCAHVTFKRDTCLLITHIYYQACLV